MKVMVCYDSTRAAKNALDLAIEQAKAFDGEVAVVTTLEKGTPEQQEKINTAKEGLDYAKSVLASKGVACTTDLLIRGLEPGEDLAQFAIDRAIDLIIIGVVRRSKVGKLIFGSTAQYLILKAHCPVLTVK